MQQSDFVMTPAIYQILLSLADTDRHGYGIMQEVDGRTGGEVSLGPGTLYRSIKRLRAALLIESADAVGGDSNEDDRRRVYRITPEGRAALQAEARRLERLVAHAHLKRVIGGTERAS